MQASLDRDRRQVLMLASFQNIQTANSYWRMRLRFAVHSCSSLPIAVTGVPALSNRMHLQRARLFELQHELPAGGAGLHLLLHSSMEGSYGRVQLLPTVL